MKLNPNCRKALFSFCVVAIAATFVHAQQHEIGSFVDARDGQSYRTIRIGGRWWMSQNLNYSTASGSWISDDDSAGRQFGRFYDWQTALHVAPAGWRLPTKQEFQLLLDSLGGTDEELFHRLGEDGSSGFEAVLTGSYQQVYGRKGYYTQFWSSTLWWFSSWFGITENPWRLVLGSGKGRPFAQIGHSAESNYGFNVRCIKNE